MRQPRALQQLAGKEHVRRSLRSAIPVAGQQVEERHQQTAQGGRGLALRIAHQIAVGSERFLGSPAARQIAGKLRLAAQQRGGIGVIGLKQRDRLPMVGFGGSGVVLVLGQIGQFAQHLRAQPQDRADRAAPNTRQANVGVGQPLLGFTLTPE